MGTSTLSLLLMSWTVDGLTGNGVYGKAKLQTFKCSAHVFVSSSVDLALRLLRNGVSFGNCAQNNPQCNHKPHELLLREDVSTRRPFVYIQLRYLEIRKKDAIILQRTHWSDAILDSPGKEATRTFQQPQCSRVTPGHSWTPQLSNPKPLMSQTFSNKALVHRPISAPSTSPQQSRHLSYPEN